VERLPVEGFHNVFAALLQFGKLLQSRNTFQKGRTMRWEGGREKSGKFKGDAL